MSNQLPFYLWKRLEGERENDRFGHRIAVGDVNGDGQKEWVIAASTATFIEDEHGVNPIPHYYCGRVYVYSHDLQLLFTLNGRRYGEGFGTSLALADLDGDGVQEILVGSPGASNGRWIESGEISVFSGKTGRLLHKWAGNEDYSRLGKNMTILDWDQDGVLDVAAYSHDTDPDGRYLGGRITIFSGAHRGILEQFSGKGDEGLGFALAAGDVDGDGHEELIIGAPRYTAEGLSRIGRVLVHRRDTGLLYEAYGRHPYDEFGTVVTAEDMDGDGAADLIIGSPKASGTAVRGGWIKIFSIAKNKLIMSKEGWFARQELGLSLTPYPGPDNNQRRLLAGSTSGAVYLLDMDGKLVHEFNGQEAEVFGHTLARMDAAGEKAIAVGAVSGLNTAHWMSGCVYFMTGSSPGLASQPVNTEETESSGDVPASSEPVRTDSSRPGRLTPKRILLATYWYLPHVGGVDAYVWLLKQELERQGHHVDVLAHHPDMAHYYLVNGDKIINKWKVKHTVYDKVMRFYQQYLAHVDPWIRYRDIERYCFELAATLFDLEQYDLIHTQDIISTRALSRVRPKSTALVATIHGLLAKEHLFSGSIETKESLAWKYVADEEYYGCISADRTIVPTDWLAKEMAQFAVPNAALHVIPYGMDTVAFLEKTQQPLSEPIPTKGSFLISCPARLVPVKGHRTLIGALHLLANDPQWHCCLLGDGELRGELELLIQSLKLTDRITLLGDRKDVPAILKRSDVMVLPSLQDNLPFSVMEAQLAGTPIVASDAGGLPEMIQHEQTGLLFKAGSEEQLAEQLVRIMKDSALREDLARRAFAWAEQQWSLESLLERTMEVYEEALDKGGRL
ncbi:hypothetical protein DCC85_17625 [Paenibacillus sp. CAA11]|uniref:glycosyltransferase n=1 Tax=Paenibacillus sp. CAA11 TaxID=1532905 RepID=UPI000D3D6B55|nr:glycosyltransferase [Paenibacillus sp. CAA11]AWB45824.1 hypothetical protein DCC85_17625 [Paenibacillus sp. CAA11]